jgi:diketogulonate reductase-like aldo/keto reductase
MKELLSDDRKPGIDKDGKVVPKIVPAVNQIELHPYVTLLSYHHFSSL